MSSSLCACAECVSLRRELTTIFGVPIRHDGETWNDSMLRQITDELGGNLGQAEYVGNLLSQADGALKNLIGRLK